MKKMIKSVLAFVCAVVFCGLAFAEESNVLSVKKIVKTYGPNDPTATVQIVTHFNDPPVTNKILYVGSMCYKHVDGQETAQRATIAGVINGTIQNLVAKGEVDVFLFGNTNTVDGVSTGQSPDNVIAKATQHLKWKDTKSITTYESSEMIGSGHANLFAYLTTLSNQLSSAKYDFVVLSMDCSRICDGYPIADGSDVGLRQKVATLLEPFYKDKHVIWIVDSKFKKTDVYPNDGDFYRPSSVTSKGNTVWPDEAWRAYCAMMDPATYLDKTKWHNDVPYTDNTKKAGGNTVYAAERNDNQTTYDELDNVTAILDKVIEIPSFTQTISDQINANLDVTAARVYTSDTELAPDAEGWTPLTGAASTESGVQVATVAGITNSMWAKFEIDVKDTDGKFLVPDATKFWCVSQSEDKVSFFFDPNVDMENPTASRGPTVALVTNEKTKEELATASAETSAPWERSLRPITINVTSYNKPYNAQSTNVLVSVTPDDPAITLKAQYSTDDGATWSEEEDYTTAKFKDVVDGAKVRVIASGLWYQTTTNDTGTVTITPLDITVTAQNAEKTYGSFDPTSFAVDFDVSAAIAINEGTTVSNDLKNSNAKIERAAGENVGTYAITNNLSKPYSAGGNYIVTFVPGTFTINPATINGYDNGTTVTKTPAWAWAKPVSIVTNDTPVGGGQLIVVETSLLKESDNPKFTYSVDGGSTWLEEAAARAELKDICYEKKVWCKVECDNYYSTNVWAYVTIQERITEIDKEAAGEWATEGSPKTDKTDDALMAVAKNISKDRTGWITADATLAITDPKGGSADGNVTAAKEAFEKRYCPPMTLLDAKPVDVKLMYIETTSAGPQTPEPVADVSKITKPIQFKVAFADTDNLKAVYHCHGEDMREMSKVSSFTSSKDFPGQYKVGDGEVTLQMGQFSTLVFVTAEAGGCDQLYCAYAYRVKLAGKTVTGKELTSGKVGGCDYESNCWAKPASFRVAGYIYNASLTEPAECEACECNVFADAQSHFWTADRKQTFANDEVTFDVFDVLRNGGFKNKAQLCIKIGENIKLAGFGAFNPQTRKLKSANGFFAGTLAAPTCGKLGEDCKWGTTPAQVFAPCALEEPIEDGATAAIVYGRWTMTYKADKVRQIEEDDNFNCLYPTGFTYSAVP